MVTLTRLSVTLYLLCLSCYNWQCLLRGTSCVFKYNLGCSKSLKMEKHEVFQNCRFTALFHVQTNGRPYDRVDPVADSCTTRHTDKWSSLCVIRGRAATSWWRKQLLAWFQLLVSHIEGLSVQKIRLSLTWIDTTQRRFEARGCISRVINCCQCPLYSAESKLTQWKG